jgi:hypothetical protein
MWKWAALATIQGTFCTHHRAEVRSVGKQMLYKGIGVGSGQGIGQSEQKSAIFNLTPSDFNKIW